jgi:hypothetical protein
VQRVNVSSVWQLRLHIFNRWGMVDACDELTGWSVFWREIHFHLSYGICYAMIAVLCLLKPIFWCDPWQSCAVLIIRPVLTNFHIVLLPLGSGMSQWYSAGLRAVWLGVRVPTGAGNFSRHHRVQTGSGAHPASYPMGTRASFPGGKATGAWSWPLTSI